MRLHNSTLVAVALAVAAFGASAPRADAGTAVTESSTELTVTLVRWPYT